MMRGDMNMIRIAVVDDEITYAQKLKAYINRYEAESGEEFEISLFSDGDEIIEKYKADFDIILLDIQMKFMNGMNAAEEIRKLDTEVVIIFITNMTQYAIRGYAVDALDYILKPVSYFAFSQRLERAIVRMIKREKHYMTLNIKGGVQKLDIARIYYIESQGHNLIFHTKNGEYTTFGTMKEMEEKLKKYSFFRGNKGYLINLEFVDSMQDIFAIVNGKPLQISRARKNNFLKALTNYLSETVK